MNWVSTTECTWCTLRLYHHRITSRGSYERVCVCQIIINTSTHAKTLDSGILERSITKINWLLSKVYCFSSSFVLFPSKRSTQHTHMWSIFFPLNFCICPTKVESVLICNKNLCKHIMRKLITFTHSPKLYKTVFLCCEHLSNGVDSGHILKWMNKEY